MLTLHDFELSGHAHRVRLMLSLLGLDYKKVTVDLLSGEHKQAPFADLNLFSLVPVLEDDGMIIRDSIAIIVYLAKKYDASWYPQSPIEAAEIQQWLALAARDIADGPARARLIIAFGAKLDATTIIENSHITLSRINTLLNNKNWMVNNKPSIADVACYSYIAHAPEGNVSLDSYPNILRWLNHVESLENFIPMQKASH